MTFKGKILAIHLFIIFLFYSALILTEEIQFNDDLDYIKEGIDLGKLPNHEDQETEDFKHAFGIREADRKSNTHFPSDAPWMLRLEK